MTTSSQVTIDGIPIGGERQIDFAVRMHRRYLSEKGADSVGVRRLHYFIVSLPEHERMIPGKMGPRPYTNNKNQYQGLSDLLVNARTRGMIPSHQIIDEKNTPLFEMPEREETNTTWEINTPFIRELPDLNIDLIPEWSEWIKGIRISPIVSHPKFVNQTYRIVVAIEKATSKTKLQQLCEYYGADLLIFSGQASVTRIYDVVTRAQEEGLPILLLYISDLDCGGWVMPSAFLDRINEIYPRKDDDIQHEMIRVALSRQQATQYNLPSAFDPSDKGYSETQKERFIKESGGRECIELDALDETVLINLLETELKKYAALEEDEQEYTQARQDANAERRSIDLGIVELDNFCEEYKSIRAEYNQIAQDIKDLSAKYRDKINMLNSRKDCIKDQVVQEIRDYYDLEAPVYDGWRE